MNLFKKAEIYRLPAAKISNKKWNWFAQRAKEKRERETLLTENIRLRIENEQQKALITRLRNEIDMLWINSTINKISADE